MSDIAGLAPLARHFFSAAKKSTQKRPPHQLRPVKSTGYPLSPHHCHAAKKLAHVKKHACSNSFHGKPMTMAQPQWLAEVEVKSKTEKQKTVQNKEAIKNNPFVAFLPAVLLRRFRNPGELKNEFAERFVHRAKNISCRRRHQAVEKSFFVVLRDK